MTPLALGLVLVSGFLHALWNLLAKRASGDAGGGPRRRRRWRALDGDLRAPGGLRPYRGRARGGGGLLFVFGTGVLHVGYFLSLQKGYQVGDLSVVYPLARGTGPLLASGAAILLLGERAGPAREIGILFGTLPGRGLLAEGGLERRLLASLCMVLGIVAIAVG